MNNKTLLLIFLFFVVVYLVTMRILNSGPVPPFDTSLIKVDTARISSIEIRPQKGPAYMLHHTDGQWIVSNGMLSLPAKTDRLLIILDQVDTIHTFELVSDKPADWARYGLAEGSGTRIGIFMMDGQKEEFIIGKTDFDPALQKSIAYLRLSGQNEVFAVNGFLPFQLEQHFNDFRNKNLIAPAGISSFPDYLQYRSLDTTLQYDFEQEEEFTMNEPDSAGLMDYLHQLVTIKGAIFADDFDELSTDRYFHQQIKLYFQENKDSLVLSCYRDSTRIQPFIIHSSDNPKSYFYSDSTGLFKTVFVAFKTLLEEP